MASADGTGAQRGERPAPLRMASVLDVAFLGQPKAAAERRLVEFAAAQGIGQRAGDDSAGLRYGLVIGQHVRAGAVGGTLGPLVQAVLNTRRVPGFVDRHYLVFEPITASG